jgi:ribosomal protein L6P/L9E
MYSAEIPKEIEIKIYEVKEKEVKTEEVCLEKSKKDVNMLCVVLENERNLIWFTTSDITYNLSDRVIVSDKKAINLIKKSISRLNFGHKRELILNGVGFKGDVIESGASDSKSHMLSLKIGKPEGANYLIPKDVTVRVVQNRVEVWSYSIVKINNFLHKILKKTPVKKGALSIVD